MLDSSVFSVFNWKYALKRLEIIPGFTNQTTGDWTAPTEAVITIQGHLSDVSLAELQFLPPAIVVSGVRKLAVPNTVGLTINDRIRVTEMDSTETDWIIYQKSSASSLMDTYLGVKRNSWVMKRKI
jgi:hypothetical protein